MPCPILSDMGNGHQHKERSHSRFRDLHWFLSVKVCLEVNWDSNSSCRQEIKSWYHPEFESELEWTGISTDSAAELYYLDPVATMDRFIGQPKFAGKI